MNKNKPVLDSFQKTSKILSGIPTIQHIIPVSLSLVPTISSFIYILSETRKSLTLSQFHNITNERWRKQQLSTS